MSVPTVACVLRASKDYRPEYVVRLYDDVRANWTGALDFLCLTDTPIGHPGIREIPLEHKWPGYWSKLELFRPDIPGHLLYLDLDVMVLRSLTNFRAIPCLTMLRALRPHRACICNSSIMSLPERDRRPVWEMFMRDPRGHIRTHKWGAKDPYAYGDQGFVQKAFERAHLPVEWWQELLPGQVQPYKSQVKLNGLGMNTRIVYFHGKPKPWDIEWRLP